MAKTKKAVPKGPDYTSWIIRVVVFAVLGVGIVLGVKELRARQAAQSSLAAVSGQMASASDEKPLLKSQVKPLIVGTPTLETADHKALNAPIVTTAERYTWSGPFRNYTVTIGYSLGADPEVELVEGPK